VRGLRPNPKRRRTRDGRGCLRRFLYLIQFDPTVKRQGQVTALHPLVTPREQRGT
jgi:hypothetical protein